MQMLPKHHPFTLTMLLTAALICVTACNNPFATRDAQKPDTIGGDAIKPPNSAENVIYNLKTSFENMSIQDYLDVFSENFEFNPDPDDSLLYVEDFRGGWDIEKERMYAENFLQRNVTKELTMVTHMYDYRAGDDLFDYRYSIYVFPAQDSTSVSSVFRYKVSGHAWLYLREEEEGKWKIYKWVELENMKQGSFITWSVLRRSNI
jgi:hypothetical protein